MNANNIWSGNDYAYVPGRGRGVTFSWSAERIKAIRVYPKYDGYGRERATSMVECVALNDDGRPKKAVSGDDLIRHVRARDIIQRWEEYEDERDYRTEQREKIERERQQEEAKKEADRTKIVEALEAKGIERSAVASISEYAVSINRHTLEEWLGIA